MCSIAFGHSSSPHPGPASDSVLHHQQTIMHLRRRSHTHTHTHKHIPRSAVQTFHGAVFAQPNYPGSTPENHPPTEECMIRSKQRRSCRIQGPGTRGYRRRKTSDVWHRARCAPHKKNCTNAPPIVPCRPSAKTTAQAPPPPPPPVCAASAAPSPPQTSSARPAGNRNPSAKLNVLDSASDSHMSSFEKLVDWKLLPSSEEALP